MKRFLCTLSYDGYDYSGYQKQNHDKNTIQGIIEDGLSQLFHQELKIFASGRTDAKVHALGQTFHVDLDITISPKQLKHALNSILPPNIRIEKVKIVPLDFHARFSVKRKVYEYRIINQEEISPFQARYYAKVHAKIDETKLLQASKLFLGTHDFECFTTNKKEEVESFEKRIDDIQIQHFRNVFVITFKGSGFLRYMVRMMVGAMLVTATGKKDISYIRNLLEKTEKEKCSFKAEPQGLYLKKVEYK